ncbi:glycoside hydrolase superfamily [Mucidula mucida]|nr:glycoside hydrolase superfamily [Mucidula mucida]
MQVFSSIIMVIMWSAQGVLAQLCEPVSSAASTVVTSISATTTAIASTVTPTITLSASFPPVGSIPRDYTPEGLDKLWDIVGPVEAPPFTTTCVPSAPVTLPSTPPPLYPSFYAPAPQDILPDLKFPPGFLFGVATAAYQVEGAAKDEGKGPTMWDWAPRQSNFVIDNTTGDITDLQYFLYKKDVERIAALAVTAHSFSISWTRILPFGAAGSPVNAAGIDHYSDVIDYHLARGIAPVVTLFHWDTPLALQAYYGGFTSPQIVDDFVNYAVTVFKAYNGRVNTWYAFVQLTSDSKVHFNEPRVYCGQIASYPFTFRALNISGEIALKNDDFIGTPWRSNNTEDSLAVERHAAFQIGVFSDPLYTTGDWPQILKDTLPESYLPRFTPEESASILGSADFYAIDPYRSQFIRAPTGGIDACVANFSHPMWPVCNERVSYDAGFGWAAGVSADPLASWLQATPVNFRAFMSDLHSRWPTDKIYVSEFGFAEPGEGDLTDLFRLKEDVARTNYFMTYLGEMLLSIHEDGVPLAGAFAWGDYNANRSLTCCAHSFNSSHA